MPINIGIAILPISLRLSRFILEIISS
jgi:hypothetical protein